MRTVAPRPRDDRRAPVCTDLRALARCLLMQRCRQRRCTSERLDAGDKQSSSGSGKSCRISYRPSHGCCPVSLRPSRIHRCRRHGLAPSPSDARARPTPSPEVTTRRSDRRIPGVPRRAHPRRARSCVRAIRPAVPPAPRRMPTRPHAACRYREGRTRRRAAHRGGQGPRTPFRLRITTQRRCPPSKRPDSDASRRPSRIRTIETPSRTARRTGRTFQL
ncbi:hypothetical protein BLA24064_05306 [Burkholderia latens]|uniref:Uncharacterized protein n=1 Tax=Burkholderia latens TaxID=488446 RepID=A0A6P2PS30_9BURK|nr:hypothetical protein BLA24064_05306 [Burkholderia latens]